MRNVRIKALPILLTIAILYTLYARIDYGHLFQVFQQADYLVFCVVVLISVFILIIAGFRWQLMTSRHYRISLLLSVKLVAGSSVFNIITPSKLGSMAKGYYMAKRKMIGNELLVSMLIYERVSDLFGMCGMFLLSSIFFFKPGPLPLSVLLFSVFFFFCFFLFHRTPMMKKMPGNYGNREGLAGKLLSVLAVIRLFHQGEYLKKYDILKINLITFSLWTLYSVQLILFFKMLNLSVPVKVILSQMYCSLFVGLLPVTIAGIGTRDAAILYLFDGYLEPHQALSIGILATVRILIPAIIGLPCVFMFFDSEGSPPDGF